MWSTARNTALCLCPPGSERSQHTSQLHRPAPLSLCKSRQVHQWTFRTSSICSAASTSSSPDVQDMLTKAKSRYEEGDRYQALKLWEQALKQKPSREQRQQALYGATCIHASFGDVEVAQTTLRDGIDSGLDFEKALDDPSMPKMSSPTQVLIQLKKFSSARKRMKAAASSSGGQQGSEGPKGSRPGLQDASKAQRSEEGDMDTSPAAIAKRVAVVVSVLVFAGVIMFLLALKFAFPELI